VDAGNNLADRTLVVCRTIAAPRVLVFDAFTDPDHLAHWWGPNGFTTTSIAFDMRVGGFWRFVMHGPDGRAYDNHVVYDEIVPPERLTFHHIGNEGSLHHATTVTFEDLGASTRLTLTVVFATAEQRTLLIKEHKVDQGGQETLARLAAMLDADAFVLSRRFAAPREMVWAMWTDAVHLAHWWGPKGFDWIFGTLDLCPDGIFHYGMRGPKDQEMWGKFVFDAIVPPERLSFVSSFSDRDSGVTRAPWFADWPLQVFNVMTLAAEGEGTHVVLKASPLHATTAERARFRSMKPSMTQGFSANFEQLDRYLVSHTGDDPHRSPARPG
jgi:uncharacterized protein YndB with AHSA1/START domain